MKFGLSEEQDMLAATVSRFLAAEAPLETVRTIADGADNAAIWQGLTDLGVPALLVPESAGGLELSALDAVVVAQCLGAAVTPVPFLATAVLLPMAVRHAGLAEDDECTAVLAGVAAGELRIGAALTDAVAPRRDAGVRWADGKLSGRAMFALDAPADHYLVADTERHLHLVAGNADGLTVQALTTIDRTRATAELVFEDVTARRLSDTPDVFHAVLDAGRVMLAADTLGAADYMLQASVAYAKEREQFGRVIGSFQAVKHMCAEMAAEIEPCRSMVWYAGHALDAVPEESRLVACHTKALLAEVGTFVARTATEVHGGMGFTDLVGLHYWFKRIGFDRQMLGAPELVREEAARLQHLVA